MTKVLSQYTIFSPFSQFTELLRILWKFSCWSRSVVLTSIFKFVLSKTWREYCISPSVRKWFQRNPHYPCLFFQELVRFVVSFSFYSTQFDRFNFFLGIGETSRICSVWFIIGCAKSGRYEKVALSVYVCDTWLNTIVSWLSIGLGEIKVVSKERKWC